MKTRLLALIAMFFVMHGLVQGQPRVAEIPSLQTDISIVRYWQNEYGVAYAWDARGTNCFMLIDRNSTSVKRIDVPSGVRVNDFRIMHDSVYLGGQVIVGGVNRGLLASFSLYDVMGGAGNFNYRVMYSVPLTDFWDTPGLNDQVADVKRIALYEESGRVNVAYIAENYVDGDPLRVGFGWAAYDAASGNWISHLMYNKHGREVYTDIITTRDQVVAVGRVLATSKLVIRAYKQTDFTNPITDPSGYDYLYPRIGQYMPDEDVVLDVKATAIDENEFAVAYHYKINSGESGLTVRTFVASGGVVSVGGVFLSPSLTDSWSRWKMREVCCTPLSNNIMVLTDYECPSVGTMESIVFHFAYPLTSFTFSGQYVPLKELQSIAPDPRLVGGFEFSGRDRSFAQYTYGFGHQGGYEPCYQRDDIWGEYKVRKTADVEMPTNTIEFSPDGYAYPFTVHSEMVAVLCGN